MSRRHALSAEVRLAIGRAASGYNDPKGLGHLGPTAFDELLRLTRDVQCLAIDLTTAKFLWHWDSMARALDSIVARLRHAPDSPSAGRALTDLYIMLTDEDRWR